MEQTVLAVDIGTSSLKAALVDARGTVVRSTRRRFPGGKRVPRDWVDAFSQAVSDLSPDAGLAAVAVSGNGPTLVGVPANGGEGALLLWNDSVSADGARFSVSERSDADGAQMYAGERSDADGAHPAAARAEPSIFIPRIRAFRNIYPDEYRRARWLVSGPEYLILALTGEAVTILPDRRYEAAYWTGEALAADGIDPGILPPFVTTGEIVGRCVLDGLNGVPVIAGGPDFFAALVGTGAIEPGVACDRAGTSEGLNLCTAEPVVHPGIRTLPSLRAEYWNASCLLPDTGARFHAWRRESGLLSLSYPEIMSRIDASPLVPEPGTATNPGRLIVEEIGFSVRKGMETLREATGFAGEYRLSGGQARNDIWNRMKADITGTTLALTATADGELMGDAIIGFAGIGAYRSAPDAAAAMVRITRRYEPDPGREIFYEQLYSRWKERHHEDLLDPERP